MKPPPRWRSNDQGWERQVFSDRPVMTVVGKLVVWWDGETILLGRTDCHRNTRDMYVSYNALHLRYAKRDRAIALETRRQRQLLQGS